MSRLTNIDKINGVSNGLCLLLNNTAKIQYKNCNKKIKQIFDINNKNIDHLKFKIEDDLFNISNIISKFNYKSNIFGNQMNILFKSDFIKNKLKYNQQIRYYSTKNKINKNDYKKNKKLNVKIIFYFIFF